MTERRLYRLSDLYTMFGFGETWVRKQIRLGRFPAGRKVSGKTHVWTDRMIESYLSALEFGLLPPEPDEEEDEPKRKKPPP